MAILHHDLHVLTGAFAVDAIDDGAERDRFERHMRHCRPCTGEVRGLTDTATRLGLAAAEPPPPLMRGRVLAAIARTRQLPPAAIAHRSPDGRVIRWIPRPAWIVAAASLVAVVVLAIAQVHAQLQLDQARARAAAQALVLAAPDARTVTQRTSAGGTATVVYSFRRHAIIFSSDGLPALPSGKVYELWLLGPPRVRPAGLLAAGQAGRSAPQLAAGLVPGDKVGLTVEPAGGTSQPTTTPILVLPLPS